MQTTMKIFGHEISTNPVQRTRDVQALLNDLYRFSQCPERERRLTKSNNGVAHAKWSSGLNL